MKFQISEVSFHCGRVIDDKFLHACSVWFAITSLEDQTKTRPLKKIIGNVCVCWAGLLILINLIWQS